MTKAQPNTYAVGQVAWLTGLSPALIRAWERRYKAIEPLRTPGGTRRYTAPDIDRLRLLKRAVGAGHRISMVVSLPSPDIEELLSVAEETGDHEALELTLSALERLDAIEAEARITGQLATLGPTRFAREFASPLVDEIGDRWSGNRLCIASEHLGSALLRSLLGAALRPTAVHHDAPIVLFATLPGESHELGLLMAAVTALGAGANPLYLGPNLSIEELSSAAARSGASAIALSSVVAMPGDLEESIFKLRQALPTPVELWVGGLVAIEIEESEGVVPIPWLPYLESQVQRLRVRTRAEAR